MAAGNLQTDEETLVEFARKSWIQSVEKQGVVYVDGHQRYKVRYILHLRNRRKLTDEQISLVLSVQQPPYSAEQVDEILKSHGKAPPRIHAPS
ncbi:MAG: hypothetical protein HY235_22965 [Acidobacteria bacterium]|nr:hypothetical protein [Acidobacteriota bacterium]